MSRRLISGCLSVFLFVIFLSGCTPQPTDLTFFAMDTVMQIHIPQRNGEQAANAAQQAVEEVEQYASATLPDSDLSRLNRSGGAMRLEVRTELWEMLELSDQIWKLSDGAFDIAMKNLSAVWGFGSETQQVPTEQERLQALETSGWNQVSIDSEAIVLTHQVQLDLGAVAKGYAARKAIEVLQKNQIQNASISLGGNVCVLGTNQGKLWKVGIANPDVPSEIIGYLELSDTSVVTSGDYQRYFEQDGKQYHHILDPQSGMPVENGLSSVTVIYPDPAMADAYSTALFVLGKEKGMLFAQQQQIQAVFVTKDKEIFCTDHHLDFHLSEQSGYQYLS